MGRPRFCLPSHIVTSLATIGAASGTVSTDADYGLTSLYDGQPSVACWFVDAPVVAVRIVYAFAQAQRLDGFALPSHTLDASLAVRFQGNATNAWGAPSLNAALTIAAPDADGHSKMPWIDLTAESGYQQAGYQYWSLYIPVNSRQVKLGQTCLIQEWQQFSRDILFDVVRNIKRPYTQVMETAAGFKAIHSHKTKIRGIVGNTLATDADLTNIETLLDDTLDGTRPFVFVLDDAVKTTGGWLVRPSADMLSSFDVTWRGPGINPSPIRFEEVSRGLPL